MATSPSPHRLVLLNTHFRPLEQRLLFPQARLFFDRIELTGWQLHERFEETILLHDVAHIEWTPHAATVPSTPNVIFHFTDGTARPLALEQVSSWRHTLENRLSWETAA